MAHTTVNSRPILGIIESISLPELGVASVDAKIDTGAYSGAIHCESVEVVKRKDGVKVLRVVPIKPSAPAVEFEDYKRVPAKSTSGHREVRYIIDTPVIVQGKEYVISISITKRDHMKNMVIIGRRFLRKYEMLVDVTLNEELDDDGGRKK